MALFLHGLARVDRAPAAPPHLTLREEGLVAIASPAPEALDQPEVMAELALHHNEVLTAWAQSGPVLPLRFGTVFSSESALRLHLKTEGAQLQAALQELGDAQEFVLRLRVVAEPVAPADGPATSGRAFLARGRQARDLRRDTAERRRAFAQDLLDRARPLARQVQPAAAPRPDRLLDAALLVDRARAEDLAQTLLPHRPLAQALGLDLALTGPWPAYGFTPGGAHVG